MSLDEDIRKEKIPRRSFLKKAVTTLGSIALAATIGSGTGCKNSHGPDPPPGPVTVRATFYNHTQGPISEKIYSGTSGEPLVVKISDIYAPGVDSQRIAVRRSASGSKLGPLIGFSRSGEISTAYPDRDSYFDVFLMNTSAGANYQLIDNWVDKGAGILLYNPDAQWQREDKDGASGPEEPIEEVISQLNDALNYSWKKYGSYLEVSSGANFGVGYNNSHPYHSSKWAGVPYNMTLYATLTGFFEEVFELQTQTDDIDGQSTLLVICDGAGRLNPVGRDLLAYVYVKDNKTP